MKEGPRFAWAITGSGHYLEQSIAIALELPEADFFLSKAVEEVLHMYGFGQDLRQPGRRVFRDTTASAVPVGQFYLGAYHTLVVAPATSNTVAKCVAGISDTLVTNVFAQAGKCRMPIIVYACDTEPVVVTPAPDREVTVYPRRVDIDSAEALGRFEGVTLVRSVEALAAAVHERARCLSTSSS